MHPTDLALSPDFMVNYPYYLATLRDLSELLRRGETIIPLSPGYHEDQIR